MIFNQYTFKDVLLDYVYMIINDDLQLQIAEYEEIDDFFEKVRFVETMVAYYANKRHNPCYTYWKAILDNLYWFGFNYY